MGDRIRAERQALELSTRELARLSGVAYPTISRIENGHEQPRLETLMKLSRVLGKALVVAPELPAVPRLAHLADCWGRDAHGQELPDWTRWRALVDRLRLHPELTALSLAEAPRPTGSPLVDNLLAALAEKLADDAKIRRPAWTREPKPLVDPWSAPATPRKHAQNVASTPEQFATRHITLPETALWRDREPVRA